MTTSTKDVPFYPVTEMTKLRAIESRSHDRVQYDVAEPVAASLDVNRHVFITLFLGAVERGEIKLVDIPEVGILGSLRLLGELLEERGHMYALFSEARGAIAELTLRAAALDKTRTQASDMVNDLELRASDVQTKLDEVDTAVIEVTETVDELEGLFDDVGDGS